MERSNLTDAEYEGVLSDHGVDAEVYRHSPGTFRAALGFLDLNGAGLHYGEHDQAFLTYVAPPPNSLALVSGASPVDVVAANGQPLNENRLIVALPNQGADLVVPALASGRTVVIPEARLYELAEAVSPELQSFDHPEVVTGDAECLRRLRDHTRQLVDTPLADLQHVCSDNLIAEWVAWLGQPDVIIERKHSVARARQAAIARRARAYFLERYAQPIRMEDACRDLCVGLRTLQRCFANYFQMTPYQYLKVVRYNKARRALLQKDPSSGSVTDIAMDNGFQHFGRFAVEYRDLFGQLPRDTLAQKPVAVAA